MEDKTSVFHQRCGEILRLVESIESAIDFFISNYFVSPQSYKTFLLRDEVISRLNFERKIGIFRKICKHEKIDENKLKTILEAINYVRKVRNKVAHYEAHVEDPEIGETSLWSTKSIKFRKDSILLTEELVKEIEEKCAFVNREIMNIYLKLLGKQ